MSRWSEDEDKRLRSLAQSGLYISQIALRMNRSHTVIRRHAAKLKIAIASGRNMKVTIERIVKLGQKAKGNECR